MSSTVVGGSDKSRSSNLGTAKSLGKRFVREFQNDDLPGLAAEVAYHLIFAIPPLIVLLVMVAALLSQFTDLSVVSSMQSLVDRHAPGDVQRVLDSVIQNAVGKVDGGAASIGAVVTAAIALWSASNGISSLMKAFNRAYDVTEERKFLNKKLLSLGLTFALIISVVIAFTLFVFGRDIGEWIARQVGLSSIFTVTWNIARWPVAIVFVMLLLTLLYYFGPNIDQSFRWVSPGSVVATMLWIGAVFGFKLYLALSNPGSTYGAFGGIVVFLFFLYITSLIFLLGAELNAVLARRYDPETAESQAGHPRQRERGTGRARGEEPEPARARAYMTRTQPESDAYSVSSGAVALHDPTVVRRPSSRMKEDRRSFGSLVGGLMLASLAGAISRVLQRRGSHQR